MKLALRFLALHSLRNVFWAENLWCAPLGTAFCSFVVLCIPLGMTFELLPIFSFFSALDGACSVFTFTYLADFALVELNKKSLLLRPIKILRPPTTWIHIRTLNNRHCPFNCSCSPERWWPHTAYLSNNLPCNTKSIRLPTASFKLRKDFNSDTVAFRLYLTNIIQSCTN